MMRLTTLLLFLCLSAAAQAADPGPAAPAAPTLADLERDVAQMRDISALMLLASQFPEATSAEPRSIVLHRLVELRPHMGSLRYELAAAYAQLDRKSDVYNLLLNLQTQGYTANPSDDPRFAKVSTTPVWGYIIKGLAHNAEPFGSGEVRWRLAADDLLIESLAWDEGGQQLLLGGAREGAVYRVDKDGSLSTLVKADAENGLWAVFDIAVDSKRGALWVASTAVPHFKGYDPEKHLGRAGVFEFDLKSGKLRNRFLSPSVLGASFFMSSITLGPDGEVYAADGVNNATYTVRNGELKRVFHAPGLTSIRGLAVSGDGKILYVADFQAGLIGYSIATGQPFELRAPANLGIGGLDDVLWWKGKLIVVQSGMEPKRILRLDISPDGRSIADTQVLLSNHAALELPTMLTANEDSVYLIANSQKQKYDRFGLLKSNAKLAGTVILQVDPAFSQPKPQFSPGMPGQ